MKRLLIAIISVLLSLTSLGAGKDDRGLTALREMNPAVFISATEPMLQSGFGLAQYGIPRELTSSLTFLQFVTINDPEYLDGKAARARREITRNMENIMEIKGNYANITVWGAPKKGEKMIFSKAVIGIGTRNKLTYIYMEGDVTGDVITGFCSPYM